MLYFSRESRNEVIDQKIMTEGLTSLLKSFPDIQKVLIIPPDFTRYHSGAGTLCEIAWKILGDKVKVVLPALGTHFPMSEKEIEKMFGSMPSDLIQAHDWRNGLTELGRISGEEMSNLSGGRLDYDWPVQVNKILVEEDWDLILSIGQVVPHEVVGMANYTKNILVGTGGKEAIDKSHFLGAVSNMEKVMGRAYTPVRQLFNLGADKFCKDLPLVYVQTVVAADGAGAPVMKGLYIGDDKECYEKAAALAQELNIVLLDKAPHKVVVYLDPEEFRSTWLGNKSIYRTRMAIADKGELIVLAPGVHCFGESEEMDGLIRKYGYHGTDHTLDLVKKYPDMAENLSVAAHLIHGSSEGRFKIRYCPGGLSKDVVEDAGFAFGDLKEYSRLYDIHTLKEGWNSMPDGEEIFYISNPALGLWALKDKFMEDHI
jgi:nickel-dependent lactate racemase